MMMKIIALISISFLIFGITIVNTDPCENYLDGTTLNNCT
jgi:hypothetical protein